MNTKSKLRIILALFVISFTACKKDLVKTDPNNQLNEPVKALNQKEKETVAKFEHASLVLQGLFSTNPSIRKEFNGFIAAKLAKSGTDEELTFKEIFEAQPIRLSGVKSDFLVRFRDSFAGTFINRKYPNSQKYDKISFANVDEVAVYYGLKSVNKSANNSNTRENASVYDESIPYEIYYPYSENFNPEAAVNYAVTSHPLNNNEWNYGMFFDAAGNPIYEVEVNDDYAYGTPTYIITYDDGLKLADFSNGNKPIEATKYFINITDDDYNPILMQSTQNEPNPSPCTSELRVKDGRWTLLQNGYGLFEGKIDFAVAVSRNLSEVTIPNQNPQSNPIIQIDRSAHAFGYVKLKRGKVRKMRDNLNEYIGLGIYVGPWCPDAPDKMMFLYEYDKPNMFSENAKEWSDFLTGAAGLIGDPATRSTIQGLTNAGLAPLVKVLLEGTAKSKIEHYSIIGSNAVSANQRIPTNGMTPSLLNGFRPYGTNSVNVSLVID
jgi:hypothetical protein